MIIYVELTDAEVNRVFKVNKHDFGSSLEIDETIKEWLDENVDWGYSDCVIDRTIRLTFTCEEDAMAFKLRWL